MGTGDNHPFRRSKFTERLYEEKLSLFTEVKVDPEFKHFYEKIAHQAVLKANLVYTFSKGDLQLSGASQIKTALH